MDKDIRDLVNLFNREDSLSIDKEKFNLMMKELSDIVFGKLYFDGTLIREMEVKFKSIAPSQSDPLGLNKIISYKLSWKEEE